MTLPGASVDVPTLTRGAWTLRPWLDSDAAAVLDLARDAAAWQWMARLRHVTDLDEALRWIETRRRAGRVDWAVVESESDRLAARVGLHDIDHRHRNAEVGYVVWPAFRRRGLATTLLTTAADHGFGHLGLARISLHHAVGNTPSCGVATTAGFAFEGVERASWDHGDGVLHDMHRHARLASDPPGAYTAGAVEPVEIAAGRLWLRPVSIDDAEAMGPILLDPEVRLWNPGPQDTSLAGLRNWCERAAAWSDGGHATFSVLDATSDELLGVVSLHRIDEQSKDAEIGYRTAPAARGRGVATDAVAAVTRWAFGALDLVRIEARHAVANVPSCRVVEKCGYRLEGTLRQAYEYGDGVRHDEHLHARLATD